MKKIGFIGLGIMGKPMAKNLLRAGYSLVVYDIRPEPVQELLSDGAEKGSSSADVAAQSEVVITMLPNSPDVRKAVLGSKGVLEGAESGMILVDMSSIAPLVSIEVAKKAAEKGVKMLDAPVSGGEPKAVDGTLAIMVSGAQEVFEEVKPILEVMGASVTLVGEIGSGNMTKLANQIIVALNIAAMSEAMVLDAKMPLALKGNFKPGFRIELHIKDLTNALDTAHELDVPIPLSSQVLEYMHALKIDGHGKDDHGGLIQFYEKIAKIEVRK
jgi:2-hydroxy-3-oxopropionate reductase